jgi:hypothetical protein
MNVDREWTPHPNNPLISPVWPEWLVGDPVVVPPEQSPDGEWHMFLNTILWIYRYTSDDGIEWKRAQRVCHGMRASVIKENDEFFLFYEMNFTPWHSVIMARKSKDLKKWSGPKAILTPSLRWEKEKSFVMSCPCIVKTDTGFKLYYSTGQVFLKDLGFPEPKYIGVAESDEILGTYKKSFAPIITPDKNHKYRNLGAGAIKVYRDDENNRWVGFNNGIYIDEMKRSRSSIRILTSEDGISWNEALPEPVISPTDGWKKALVYQLGMVERPNGDMWLYYNSRDGWRKATERIGLEIGRRKNEVASNK